MLRLIQPLDLAFLWIDRPESPSNVGIVADSGAAGASAFGELRRSAGALRPPAAAAPRRRRAPAQDLTLRKPPARSPSRTRRMPASQRS